MTEFPSLGEGSLYFTIMFSVYRFM